MNSNRHPLSSYDVTPEWLSEALGASGVLGDSRVSAFDFEIIGQDRGFTGVVARLTPHYRSREPGAPDSLVAKFPLAERAGGASYREHVMSNPELARRFAERAAREVHFYSAIGGVFSQRPACYYGHADVGAGEVVLLLEDLAGGVPGDALAGCTVDEARSVLNGLAEFHARGWGDHELLAMDWLGDWPASISGRADSYRQQAAIVVERYREQLRPEVLDLISSLAESIQSTFDDLARAPATLTHGDFHLDNVMFMPPADGPVAYIIDWQSVASGPALLDVGGFLAESLDIEDRRVHERRLLGEYHEGLAGGGVRGYPFERMYADYQRAIAVRFAGVVGWLSRVEIDDLEGRERALVEAIVDPGRVFVAMLDHFGDGWNAAR